MFYLKWIHVSTAVLVPTVTSSVDWIWICNAKRRGAARASATDGHVLILDFVNTTFGGAHNHVRGHAVIA